MSNAKQVSVSKRKLALALISIALVCSLASGSFVYVIAQSGGSTPITISSGIYPGAPTATIWADGSTYYSKTAYGVATSSSTVATLLSSVVTSNSKVLINSNIALASGLSFTSLSNVIIELKGTVTVSNGALTGGAAAFSFTSCSNVDFSGGIIDGNYANNPNEGELIALISCTSPKIHDITLTNSIYFALGGSANTNINFYNINASNNYGGGIWYDSTGGLITNNICNNNNVGIPLHPGHGFYGQGTNITLSGNTAYGQIGGYDMDTTNLQGSTFSNNHAGNLDIRSGCNGNTITGNTFNAAELLIEGTNNIVVGNKIIISEVNAGIVLLGNNNLCSDNYVSGTSGSAGGFINVVGSNNTVSNNFVTNGYEGIEVTGILNVVTNNKIIGITGHGLILNSAANGNQLIGNQITNNTKNGILINSGATNNQIKNNYLANNAWGNIVVSAASGNTFKDNFGFITEDHGSTTTSGSGATIDHHLAGNATSIIVSFTGNVTSYDIYNWGPSAFDVNNIAPYGSHTIYWQAFYDP
jgi:hypothetical protein